MEGQEDGRTWNFDTEGPRRTMNVAGGISGRAPYHWDGALTSFGDLVTTVYNQRMGGPALSPDQTAAAQSWMNAIPRLPGVVSDPDAVARGQVVFSDSTHGCALCHSGAQLTTNRTNLDVGTGGTFEIPSLVGLAYTAPYLHDGCAATLADRFGCLRRRRPARRHVDAHAGSALRSRRLPRLALSVTDCRRAE